MYHFHKQCHSSSKLVPEPAIGLINWLRPNSMKVCSYAEKCTEFKNKTKLLIVVELLSLHHPLETTFLQITMFLNTYLQI